MPTLSMFDQKLFQLKCGHGVVLGRLDGREIWICDEPVNGKRCEEITDLHAEPYRSQLAEDRDLADEIDKQARDRGEQVVRAND